MLQFARPVAKTCEPGTIRFSIATLVTDYVAYMDMIQSFVDRGFHPKDCEFIFIDNSKRNSLCAYKGLNRLLDEAVGDFIILCHQDVRLIDDGRSALEARLEMLDRSHPDWALAGNAGGVAPGKLALCISDPHGENLKVGNLPEKVTSLDENFIVLRRQARLGFSHDLSGFHLYGADICLAAQHRGMSAYVIDFHLKHLSAGSKDGAFQECAKQFRQKYSRALRGRWIQTTCTLLFISGSPLHHRLGGAVRALYEKLSRRLPGARGWNLQANPRASSRAAHKSGANYRPEPLAGATAQPGDAATPDASPARA